MHRIPFKIQAQEKFRMSGKHDPTYLRIPYKSKLCDGKFSTLLFAIFHPAICQADWDYEWLSNAYCSWTITNTNWVKTQKITDPVFSLTYTIISCSNWCIDHIKHVVQLNSPEKPYFYDEFYAMSLTTVNHKLMKTRSETTNSPKTGKTKHFLMFKRAIGTLFNSM